MTQPRLDLQRTGPNSMGGNRAESSDQSSKGPKVRIPHLPAALRLLILGAFIVLWELAADRWVSSLFISQPSLVLKTLVQWTTDGTLWHHTSATLQVAATGFVIGAFGAIMAGYVLGVSQFWASVFEPFITALYALPKVAIIPLLIVWVGIGAKLGATVSALIVFLLLFYNTFYGIKQVSPKLLDAVRVMGGTWLDVAVRVRAPSALVWVVAGLRISIPQALVGVVTAEILAGNRGLGYLVNFNAGQFNTAGTIAAIIVLLILGMILDLIVRKISRRALRWNDPT